MKTSRLVVALFGSATILVVIIVLLAFQAVDQNEQAAVERKKSLVVLDTVGRLLSSIKDAETGQRGYLLTGDKDYLNPYLVAQDKIKVNLQSLRTLTSDDSAQQQRLDSLQPILEERMTSLITNVELVQNNEREKALLRMQEGSGQRLMNQIRAIVSEFEEREAVVLIARDANFKSTLNKLSLINALSSIIILFVALASSFFVYRESNQRVLVQAKANRELEIANKHLLSEVAKRQSAENELRIAATAFESQEGMLVTDANSTILRVNNAFTNITGYSLQEAVGKTPSILSSGRHDAEFYAQMWEQINSVGEWEGDIWNRRKNGEIFPERLTITAIKNSESVTVNYVATLTDITESVAAEEEIKHLAFYDPLTQLPNRRLLLDRLDQALAHSARSGERGALLFIDLDHFKTLNDTLGHDVGDLLLQQVAERLQKSIRRGDTVARLGGDEFVVMLEGLNGQSAEVDAQQAEVVASKIIELLGQEYILGRHVRKSSPSIGITLFSGYKQSVDELLKQADIAMYKSKSDGRNRMRFFDPEMQSIVVANAALELDLRAAQEKNQFQLYYQLQATDGKSVGAEVLIRWLHPQRGMVMPMEFIALAEETGLILPIGTWVLETACAQLKAWEATPEMQHLSLAVNVSARQFHQPDFVDSVVAIIEKIDLKQPHKLKLELTESVVLKDVGDTVLKMKELKKFGIRFSMDDFGTGYSSLSYLTQLPLDQLKIDQSFVKNIGNKPIDAVIVQTIIGMAQNLKMDVIAEGVETEEQRLFLAGQGCTSCQGYLFSKPVPLEEFEQLVVGRGDA